MNKFISLPTWLSPLQVFAPCSAGDFYLPSRASEFKHLSFRTTGPAHPGQFSTYQCQALTSFILACMDYSKADWWWKTEMQSTVWRWLDWHRVISNHYCLYLLCRMYSIYPNWNTCLFKWMLASLLTDHEMVYMECRKEIIDAEGKAECFLFSVWCLSSPMFLKDGL